MLHLLNSAMRLIVVNLILYLAPAAEVKGDPYLKLLQDALRIGERAREGEAFDGIRKDIGDTFDGIKKDLETNLDFQLRWMGLRWNETGRFASSYISCCDTHIILFCYDMNLTLPNCDFFFRQWRTN